MPVAQAAATTRPVCGASSSAPTRRCRGAGLAGVDELDEQVRKVLDGATGLTYDGEAVEFPAPAKFARPIAFNVLPLAGKVRRRRLGRDRRGAEAPQREPQDPRAPGPARLRHVRAGAGVHRPLAVASTPSSSGRSARPGPARCWPPRPGVELVDIPTPLQAAGQRPELRRAHPPRPAVPEAGVWRCSSRNDNLRKGAALNAVQIAELIAAEATGLSVPLSRPPVEHSGTGSHRTSGSRRRSGWHLRRG